MHTDLVGNSESLAFQFGPTINDSLREIRIFAVGKEITNVDRNAFVGQFRTSLQVDIDRLEKFDPHKVVEYFESKSPLDRYRFLLGLRCEDANPEYIAADQVFEHYAFLDWGPTTDESIGFLLPDGEDVALVVAEAHSKFRKPRSVRVKVSDIIGYLRQALVKLKSKAT